MNNGYIKLYRCIQDNPVLMQDMERLGIWIYLLINATHKECDSVFGGKRITLKAGQLVTGTMKIATTLNVSKSKVYRTLKLLESEKQIETQTSSQNSLITILNWEMYQGSETPFETQVKREWNASETQVERDRNASENIQECNNVKNVKNVRSKKADEPLIVPDTLSDGVKTCVNYFIEYRRNDKKKPMTQRAVDMLAKQLLEMPNDAVRINSIEHSIACGYQGVFEYTPKNNAPKQPTYESPLSYYRRQAEKGGNDGEVFEGRCEETDSDDELPFS